MALNNIINRHVSAFAESYVGGRKKSGTRKYNRTIAAEAVAVTAKSVLTARAENVRLRTKAKVSYLVASGEAATAGQADAAAKDNMFKRAGKAISNFVKMIIEAITNFFRGFKVNEKRWAKVKEKLQKKSLAGDALKRGPIEVYNLGHGITAFTNDLVNATKYAAKTAAYVSGGAGAKDAIRNIQVPEVPTWKLNKEDMKTISTPRELNTYVSTLLSLGDETSRSVAELRGIEKHLREYQRSKSRNLDANGEKVDKDKDFEAHLRNILKTVNRAIGQYQVIYGALLQIAGKLLKQKSDQDKDSLGDKIYNSKAAGKMRDARANLKAKAVQRKADKAAKKNNN